MTAGSSKKDLLQAWGLEKGVELYHIDDREFLAISGCYCDVKLI